MNSTFDSASMAPLFSDRAVLITGGSGSFGHEFLSLLRPFGHFFRFTVGLAL